MIGRFVVINTIGFALALVAYLTGVIELVWTADRIYSGPVLLSLTLLGLLFVSLRRYEDAQWIADKLPVLALIGTVMGIILAVNGVEDMSTDAARMQVFTDVSHSLVANMFGMIGYFWLELVLRVCKNDK